MQEPIRYIYVYAGFNSKRLFAYKGKILGRKIAFIIDLQNLRP